MVGSGGRVVRVGGRGDGVRGSRGWWGSGVGVVRVHKTTPSPPLNYPKTLTLFIT